MRSSSPGYAAITSAPTAADIPPVCSAPIFPTARVLAVADAYDAITCANNYRHPSTPTEAVQELRRHTRRQFDVDAVNALADWVATSEGSMETEH